MSGNERAYVIGVTNLVVGLSAAVEFTPPAGMISGTLEVSPAASGGTLAIVGNTSAGTADGYVLNALLPEYLEGPARFFLAATGATMIAQVMVRGSAGASFG